MRALRPRRTETRGREIQLGGDRDADQSALRTTDRKASDLIFVVIPRIGMTSEVLASSGSICLATDEHGSNTDFEKWAIRSPSVFNPCQSVAPDKHRIEEIELLAHFRENPVARAVSAYGRQ